MPRLGTTNVWTADQGISARPRPQTVIGHAERVTRGLPRLPTMSDAKSSYMSTLNTNAMLSKRACYFKQRCPYDTVPKRIPGCSARGGHGSLQHAQVESPDDTWPITIPMNRDLSQALLGTADDISSASAQSAVCSSAQSASRPARNKLAYPSSDWTVRMDRSGRQYYVNKFDKRISWTFPAEDGPAGTNGRESSPRQDSKAIYIAELEDRILQRYSSDMLAVPEGSKKDVPDPLRDALLNKRPRREERGVLLENAHGATVMALVEGGRDGNLSRAAPNGLGQPGIHQSISRGLSGPTRVLRNLSQANIVTVPRAMGAYSQLQHGCRKSDTGPEDHNAGGEHVPEVAVFDSRPSKHSAIVHSTNQVAH